MDKDITDARKKAIEALDTAIGFWGIDPLEAKIYGTLFLNESPMTEEELAEELAATAESVEAKLKVLMRLGAVKELPVEGPDSPRRYRAESDFFSILQTVLKERREKEMGNALQEISDQRAFVEYRYEEEGDPELKFLAARLGKLEDFIHLIDKAMFGLRAFAGFRDLFKGKKTERAS
ncbi:MAG: helix-turn-helix domain-containing protein [Nitrospirota bacterium]